jgi:four helix bundle protein
VQDFRQLKVWEVGHRLTLNIYRASRSFPSSESYGITSQMRRCSASIPANIAEGCGRGSDAEFSRFLQIAMGSASELEYFLLLSRDLEYLDVRTHEELTQSATEVKRMLTSLMQTVRKNAS